MTVRAGLLLLVALAGAPAWGKCEGDFPNPVADVCWSCMFPIRLGGTAIASAGQLDNHTNSGWLCSCKDDLGIPRLGINAEFWEPARMVEVTRTPFCLVALDGLHLDPGYAAREPGARSGVATDDGTVSYAFYHVHWYVNPLLHWLGLALDFPCLERAGIDLAYMSELDPTWEDDQLANIIAPHGLAAANLPAVASCAADCVASATGWPRDELWWCAGCVGQLFPPNGNVAAHVSGRQSSALLAARLAQRMHATGASFYTHGDGCGPFFQARLDKGAYKMTMLHPHAQGKRNGRCCEPFGTSPELWARGAEWPVTGEDYVYLLFRKRTCCAGAT